MILTSYIDDPTPTELENADLATKMCWLEERVGEIIEKYVNS